MIATMQSSTSLVITFSVLTLICADIVYNHSSVRCPRNCKCQVKEAKINCSDVIPKWIPKNIKEVTITDPSETVLSPRVFCNVSWRGVAKLTICSFQDDMFLYDNVFMCLDQIESLKIQSPDKEVHFRANTFAGLTHVSRLDLAGCSRIVFTDIDRALKANNTLPNLSYLILSNVARSFGPIELSQDLINFLGARHIVELDLSSTELTSSGRKVDLTPVCHSLVTLNFSNAVLSYDLNAKFPKPCHSLTILDISSVHFPRSQPLPNKMTIKNLPLDIGRLNYIPFQTLSVLYANALISSAHVIALINCTVNVSFENMLTEIHGSGYTLPIFDLEMTISPNHLKYVDLSSNSIENIGPTVFRNLRFLSKIDLSNNKLSQTRPFNETFSVLFRNNPSLVGLNLANNKLTFLPKETFIENKYIKHLYLSGNMFEKIKFDIVQLNNLTFLDLRDNKIEYLDKPTRDALDQLYHMQYSSSSDENKRLEVDLHGNPLSCKCAALEFLKWFVRSGIFSATRHMYHCQTQGGQIVMDDSAIAEAKEDCEIPIRRRNRLLMLTIIPTLSIAAIVVVGIFVVRRRRKNMASKRLEERVRLLHDNDTGFQFPIFLSYSSEDEPFVYENIYKPLQVRYTNKILIGHLQSVPQDQKCENFLHDVISFNQLLAHFKHAAEFYLTLTNHVKMFLSDNVYNIVYL